MKSNEEKRLQNALNLIEAKFPGMKAIRLKRTIVDNPNVPFPERKRAQQDINFQLDQIREAFAKATKMVGVQNVPQLVQLWNRKFPGYGEFLQA